MQDIREEEVAMFVVSVFAIRISVVAQKLAVAQILAVALNDVTSMLFCRGKGGGLKAMCIYT